MKLLTIILKLMMFLLVVFIVVFNSVIYAQPVQHQIFDPQQYPGYPVKTVLVPVQPTMHDSIPLHLLKVAQSADITSIFVPYVDPIMFHGQYYWGEGYPYFGQQWWPPVTLNLSGIYFITGSLPVCGDSFHENGQLSSRVECVDSVYHGKAIYWDETGHKTSESTYFEGKQIKQKSYDSRGRLTHLNHFDYNGAYDGICIYYDHESNTKSVTRYEHGIQHGLQEEYRNDKIESKTFYDQGVMTQRQHFHDNEALMNAETFLNDFVLEGLHYSRNGRLIYHEKRNELGEMLFIKRWSETGVITEEKNFVNGKLHGTVIVSYDILNELKETEQYDNGILLSYSKTYRNQPVVSKLYEKGMLKSQLNFTENGDTTYYAIYNEKSLVAYEKLWNDQLQPIKEIHQTFDSMNVAILNGEGFYTVNGITYLFNIESEKWYQIETRIVFDQTDTIRKEYVANNSGVSGSPVLLSSNNFIKIGNRSYPDGEWKYYSENNLDSVITFQNGVRNGRAVYYQSTDDSVELVSFGYYQNNKKEGVWVYFQDQLFVENLTIAESEMTNNNEGLDSVIINYSDNVVNGRYQRFDSFGRLKVEGYFLNGEPVGKWNYYNNVGEIERKVNYRKGEPTRRNFS